MKIKNKVRAVSAMMAIIMLFGFAIPAQAQMTQEEIESIPTIVRVDGYIFELTEYVDEYRPHAALGEYFAHRRGLIDK